MAKKVLISLAILLVIVIIAGFSGYQYVQSMLLPVDANSSTEEIISIPKGSNTAKVAKILKENDMIKNETVFKYYTEYNGYDAQLKAGNFKLQRSMSLEDIVRQLVNGNAFIETVKFTIPEGYNVVQIATKLSEEGLVDKEKFLELAKAGDFDYDFVKAIPKDQNINYLIEGYLFPETYVVKKGATEKEIIEKMLSQFDKEWKEDWTKQIKNSGLTIHQLVTLASIVEREVVADKERPIVAGVFYNRLRDSWNLQSCATVQFILGKQKDNLTFKDLKIDNPYNTYENAGLPPGPIGSPGRKSLEASVYPAKHDYYFFVTKKDGTGEHFFSKTYKEHMNNNAKSQGNW